MGGVIQGRCDLVLVVLCGMCAFMLSVRPFLKVSQRVSTEELCASF